MLNLRCAYNAQLATLPSVPLSAPQSSFSRKLKNLGMHSSLLRDVISVGAVFVIFSAGPVHAAELSSSQVFSMSCAGSACPHQHAAFPCNFPQR